MLQSIKPRVQQPLLTSAPESPILTAKQDPRRRIKRTDTPPRLAPKPNKQPQHRRHYSVPDNVLLSITATPIGNIDLNLQHPSQIKAFDSGSAVDLGTERQRQEHQGNSNFFLQQSQLQQIHTAHPGNTQYSHSELSVWCGRATIADSVQIHLHRLSLEAPSRPSFPTYLRMLQT